MWTSMAENPLETLRAAREGKRMFLVKVVKESRYRVWATDSNAAEEAVYWRLSSGRPYPEVDDLGNQPTRYFTEPSGGLTQ